MLKKQIKLWSSCLLLLVVVPAFSGILPEYQGVKPSPSQNQGTEAQLQDPLLCEKGCERQVHVQRDRDPHGLSPQEAHNLVKKVLPKKSTTPPPTDGDGSR